MPTVSLRLIVDSAGNRQWIFRFIWRSTIRDMVLGGSELSLAVARERAIEAEPEGCGWAKSNRLFLGRVLPCSALPITQS